MAYSFLALATGPTWCEPEKTQVERYRSPYSVKFTYSKDKLIGDITAGKRGDPRQQSTLSFDQWYSAETRKKWGAWGPPAKTFDAPAEAADKPPAWKRERILAIAMR